MRARDVLAIAGYGAALVLLTLVIASALVASGWVQPLGRDVPERHE